MKKVDIAPVAMCLLAFTSLSMQTFMLSMRSRIGKIHGISASNFLGDTYTTYMLLLVGLLVLVLFLKQGRRTNLVIATLSNILLLYIVWLSASCIPNVPHTSPNFRVTFGTGFYLLVLSLSAILIICNKREKQKAYTMLICLPSIIGILLLFYLGELDALSVIKEYQSRKEIFHREFIRHLSVCLPAILMAFLLGLPLGYTCFKFSKVQKVVSFVLHVIQAIPSLAFICLLMPPLAYLSQHSTLIKELGISGFGFAPVFCALFFYALFQIVTSVQSALLTIPPLYIETAKAMGMSSTMIFWSVQMRIILPVIISSVRVTCIQIFSAATLGALVGFGGLGFFMMGGGNLAIDLVLLGVIPLLALIFICDFLLHQVASYCIPRGIQYTKNENVYD